jgi:hypothetical protein
MAAVCSVAIRRAPISPIDICHGGFGFLFAAATVAFCAYALWSALPEMQRHYRLESLSGGGATDWFAIAFAALASALFLYLQRGVRRRIGTVTLVLGVMCCATVALVAMSVWMPGASYLLAWPLLALQAAVTTVLVRGPRATPGKLPVMLAGAIPSIVLLAPAVRDLFAAFSLDRMNFPVLLLVTLLGLTGPLLAALALRPVVRVLMLGGAACLGVAHSANVPAVDLPAANDLIYLKDTPSWQAYWVMPPHPLDAWTRQIFPNTMHPYMLPYVLGVGTGPVWYAAAPRNDRIAYPDLLVQKLDDTRERHVEFQLVSKNRAPKITMRIDGAEPRRASVNGSVLTDIKTRHWSLSMYGMGDVPLNFSFDIAGVPGFRVFVQEHIPGLPVEDLPARSPDIKPVLLPMTGKTIASDILLFP